MIQTDWHSRNMNLRNLYEENIGVQAMEYHRYHVFCRIFAMCRKKDYPDKNNGTGDVNQKIPRTQINQGLQKVTSGQRSSSNHRVGITSQVITS